MTAQHRRLGFATVAVAIIFAGVWTAGDSNWKFLYLLAAVFVLWAGIWFERRGRRDVPPSRREKVEALVAFSPILATITLAPLVEWVTGSSTAGLVTFLSGSAISIVLRRIGLTKRLAEHFGRRADQ